MDWRSQLRPASFRGVPFFYSSARYESGRRIKMHEFPGRDIPYPEDLGKKAKEYPIEAYVLQPLPAEKSSDTVFTRRDRLIAALELGGPGLLIHPYWGRLQVVVPSFAVGMQSREGGCARFTITFADAGAAAPPTQTCNTQAAVAAAAVTASNALQSDFANTLTLAGKAAWLSNAVTTKLGQLTQAMNSLSNLATLPASVTSVVAAVSAFSAGLTGVISSPADLAFQIVGLVNLVPSLVSQPIDALNLYKHGLFNFGSSDAALSTTEAEQVQAVTNNPAATEAMVMQLRLGGVSPSNFQKDVNNQAINTLVVASALVAYASAASTVPAQSDVSSPSAANPQGSTPSASVIALGTNAASGTYGYDSSDAAQTALQVFLDALEDLFPFLPDSSFAAMLDLRAALILDLQTRASSLPSLIQWTPPATMPAIVIAQRLYLDPTRADEICRRNGIVDPNFVPGGFALEVLSA